MSRIVTETIEVAKTICANCDKDVYTCDGCAVFIEADRKIICDEKTGKHYHRDCYP